MDIKETIRINNLKQWQVAEKAGINEFILSRLLRRPEKISETPKTTKLVKEIDFNENKIKMGRY